MAFEVLEGLAYLRDLARIEEHLEQTTENPSFPKKRITEIREKTAMLADFPHLGVARPDLLKGVRILVVDDKALIACVLREDREQILLLRAFYGGEDYQAILADWYD